MFEQVFENILNVFRWIPIWFSNIRLIGSFDLWDFIIIMMCMSAILPVIVVTLKTRLNAGAARSAREKRRGEKEAPDFSNEVAE